MKMIGQRLCLQSLRCQLPRNVTLKQKVRYQASKFRGCSRHYSTKPTVNGAKETAKSATPAPAEAKSAGGGSTGTLLLLAALAAPPAYVAYKLNMDADDKEFKQLIEKNAPFVVDLLGPKAGTGGDEKVQFISDDDSSIAQDKDEIESLAARLQSAETKNRKEAALAELPKAVAKKTVKETKPSAKEPVEEDSPAELSPIQKTRESIDKIRSRVRKLKNSADKSTEEKLASLESELRSDLEEVLAQDIAAADVTELRKRIVQLVLELKDRHRWEALRLHELTKVHTEELVAKYSSLLRDQGETYEKLLKQEVQKAVDETVKVERARANEKITDILGESDLKWKHRLEMELQHQNEVLGKKMDHIIKEEKIKIEEYAAKERKDRLAKLKTLQKNIDHLEGVLNKRQQSDNFSSQVHSISVALFDLIEHIPENKPLKTEILALESAANGDPVITKALESLPERLKTVGIPTKQELETRFDRVYESCKKVALVPEDGGGMLEHALASIVATLSLSENANINELKNKDDPEAILARAKYYIEHEHDLEAAVKEFDSLSYSMKETASDWLVIARDKIQAEQILKFIRAHVSSLALDAYNKKN
mmetsp:Transcript_708/g.1082  ORF Transcript_708/g.1082 Transcript_708/m.1082 type:complete len:597 (+) Transcript_708:280-2070(+)